MSTSRRATRSIDRATAPTVGELTRKKITAACMHSCAETNATISNKNNNHHNNNKIYKSTCDEADRRSDGTRKKIAFIICTTIRLDCYCSRQ